MNWSSSKLEKAIFWKKKKFLSLSYKCLQSTIKKMGVKRSRNVKYLFYKNNAEENGTFHIQMMFKGGNKHARITCGTCSKLSIRAQKQRHMFSIWTTFNNRHVVLLINIQLSQSEYNFTSEYFRRNKQKNEHRKENHRKKTNYFIEKYATS